MISILATGCLFAYPLSEGRVAIGQLVNMGEVYVPPSHVFQSNVKRPIVCRTGSGWILHLPRA